VWADNDPEQNPDPVGLHVNFRLNRDGDRIGLYAPDGSALDLVAFGAQRSDESGGRWPDGADAVYPAMLWPTPGASNVALRLDALNPAAGGGASLEWAAASGMVFRVEAAADLPAGDWRPVGAVTARAARVEFTDPAGRELTERFYRVRK
jgi:hypothetical protein